MSGEDRPLSAQFFLKPLSPCRPGSRRPMNHVLRLRPRSQSLVASTPLRQDSGGPLGSWRQEMKLSGFSECLGDAQHTVWNSAPPRGDSPSLVHLLHLTQLRSAHRATGCITGYPRCEPLLVILAHRSLRMCLSIDGDALGICRRFCTSPAHAELSFEIAFLSRLHRGLAAGRSSK